ncbi:HAD-IIB family hydrolase [Desulforapulum autotrophicum]|nr:HAD-IIB family hydrolase [Desulforapulum autotrophicum]
MSNKLLLCTDMDRTVIPNGLHPEHPDARAQFRRLCNLPEIVLAYVTGRHLQLVEEAIKKYNLPEPDFIITDVGTKIYQKTCDNWISISQWQKQIAKDWQGKTHYQLQQALSRLPELKLQENSKQNDYKLSYYLPLSADHGKIEHQASLILAELGVNASLILSIDEPEQVGLLDVLPKNATKLHAIIFLQEYLDLGLEETIFCGDSGNDLPVLGSQIRSVLVANADRVIKKRSLELAEKNGSKGSLYVAEENDFPLGGNYCAGVLQGIAFYEPQIIKRLKIS